MSIRNKSQAELHAEAVEQESQNTGTQDLAQQEIDEIYRNRMPLEEYVTPAVVEKVVTVLLLDLVDHLQNEIDYRVSRNSKARPPKEMTWGE